MVVMKRISGIHFLLTIASLLAVFLLFSNRLEAASEIAINERNFPDDNFRDYVSYYYDTNKDDYLDNTEIANAKTFGYEVSSVDDFLYDLKGIEYLTALERIDFECTYVNSLDLS